MKKRYVKGRLCRKGSENSDAYINREVTQNVLFPDLLVNKSRHPEVIKRNGERDIVDLGDRGGYHSKNTLNDLTGKEWKFATRSVITKVYPANLQHNLRRQHGGQKPPDLCADLIRTFTKEGAIILDPFAGVGGTLLGAAICKRKAIGIEINPKWVEIYKKVCKLEGILEQEVIIGDCKKELKKLPDNFFDFILTDVPYWNMDKLEKTRSKRTRRSKLSQFNSSLIQTKEEWLNEMKTIFNECKRVLKNKKYMAIFIGDMYRANEYHILSADLANNIKDPHLILKAILIWYDVSKTLHVYGYPTAFIPSMIHQNILIFRKEE